MSESKDLRGKFNDDLEAFLDAETRQLILNNILAVTKQAHAEVRCKHCGKNGKYLVEIPDALAVSKALIEWVNQAKGRPDVASVEEQDRIVFVRKVPRCSCGGCKCRGVRK